MSAMLHYPPLHERAKLPALYMPTCFLCTLFPFFIQNRTIAVAISFPILLVMVIRFPCYTSGDPSSDYYNGGPIAAMLLWYLDFIVFTPWQGPDGPVYLGSPHLTKSESHPKVQPLAWSDLSSVWQKLSWVFRLMIPPNRGIGWNWQIKGVPLDYRAELEVRPFVLSHVWHALVAYLRSALMLVILGFGSSLQEDERFRNSVVVNAVIGWSGAIWVWDRLNCFYSLSAAVAVAVGLCETWEWPPLTGSIGDAWSVRQMWSVVYHQVMRRLLQQPALRLARTLGLRKGTLTSKYLQLYVSFAISCVFHQFQMFNVTRKDGGQFAFFMSQPVAITVEDMVQALWSGYLGQRPGRFSQATGYVWTVGWFSCSLPIYVKGLRDAGIIRDVLFGMWLSDMGSSMGRALLR